MQRAKPRSSFNPHPSIDREICTLSICNSFTIQEVHPPTRQADVIHPKIFPCINQSWRPKGRHAMPCSDTKEIHVQYSLSCIACTRLTRQHENQQQKQRRGEACFFLSSVCVFPPAHPFCLRLILLWAVRTLDCFSPLSLLMHAYLFALSLSLSLSRRYCYYYYSVGNGLEDACASFLRCIFPGQLLTILRGLWYEKRPCAFMEDTVWFRNILRTYSVHSSRIHLTYLLYYIYEAMITHLVLTNLHCHFLYFFECAPFTFSFPFFLFSRIALMT